MWTKQHKKLCVTLIGVVVIVLGLTVFHAKLYPIEAT
jgi:hypothetical protein